MLLWSSSDIASPYFPVYNSFTCPSLAHTHQTTHIGRLHREFTKKPSRLLYTSRIYDTIAWAICPATPTPFPPVCAHAPDGVSSQPIIRSSRAHVINATIVRAMRITTCACVCLCVYAAKATSRRTHTQNIYNRPSFLWNYKQRIYRIRYSYIHPQLSGQTDLTCGRITKRERINPYNNLLNYMMVMLCASQEAYVADNRPKETVSLWFEISYGY